MLNIQLPKHLERRIIALAQATKRSKSSIVREALERSLEDIEDYHAADAAYSEFVASGKESIPLEKVMKKYGLDCTALAGS